LKSWEGRKKKEKRKKKGRKKGMERKRRFTNKKINKMINTTYINKHTHTSTNLPHLPSL
jgi:hypothetical protein